jgi:hypothetical protein
MEGVGEQIELEDWRTAKPPPQRIVERLARIRVIEEARPKCAACGQAMPAD